MKILLLGKNGQLGWELQRSLALLGSLVSLDRQGLTLPSGEHLVGDLGDPAGLVQSIRLFAPDVIVNAAAHTAVDKAESEPELAQTLNAEAPVALAQLAAELGAWLVHFSTDYVFDGAGDQPFNEASATGPLSTYGRSKLDGENAIRASGCRHLIFRTSWVYGARGGNFAKTMLRLARERDTLSVINDQIGAPTGADLLADITAHALRHVLSHGAQASGTYHAVAAGETSWYGYAQFVLQTAQGLGQTLKVQPENVSAIPSSSYPTPAKRPLNSRLDTTKLQQVFGLTLPHWQHGVERMLREVLTN